MEPRTRLALLPGLLCLLMALSLGFAGTTERVSVSGTGEQADGSCQGSLSISGDGRYVVFASEATNLVPGDTTGVGGLFLRDRQTGETRRIAPYGSGDHWPDWGFRGRISADGRFVVYNSYAADLVPADTNGASDVFLYTVADGSTRRISVSASGGQANGDSMWPDISADGRYVVFASDASNLVSEDHGLDRDIYICDTTTGDIACVSTNKPADSSGGCEYPAISGEGRYVVYSLAVPSQPNDMRWLELFRVDLRTKDLQLLSMGIDGYPAQGDCWNPALSADGRYVVFESIAGNLSPGDIAQWSDIFRVDCEKGAITRESIGRDGEGTGRPSYNPAITPDGRFIAFDSTATNLLATGMTRMPSVFVRDQQTERTDIAGLTSDDGEGNQVGAVHAAISADARFVAFLSPDSNFVAGDTNDTWDVFVRDRQTFADVPVGLWSYDWVEACTNSGVVTGYPGGNYRPGEEVTRAQMAVYLARGLAGGDANVPTGPAVASFPDVGTDHWAYRYIEYVASPQMNVVQGFPGGNYRPDLVVNRGQMAVYIARAMVTPSGDAALPDPPAEPTFSDVTADNEWSWCYPQVEYLAAEGVAQGYPGGLAHPEYAVTRDQMAVYLARALRLPM